MQIRLVGWESRGFRCPDIEVDLREGGRVPKVSLVQMPNGTGKTTTLNLLRAALTGHASSWEPERIRKYRKQGSSASRGEFKAVLLVDGNEVTIELLFDYENGEASYRTSHQRAGGLLRGWKPPSEVRKFLTDQFIRLFLFDGELAEKLLESGEHEAEKAIDALFQLYIFDSVVRKAEERWKRQTKEKTGKTAQARTLRQNKLDEIDEQLQKMKAAREEAEQEKERRDREASKLQAEINERIDRVGQLREERKKAEAERDEAQEKVSSQTQELLACLRSPEGMHKAFSSAIANLKGGMDTLKLPSNTTKQFFLELVEQEECICGSELDEESRQTILDKSEEFLGADTSGFVNTLKNDIGKYIGDEPNAPFQEAEEQASALTEAMDARASAESSLRAVHQQLVDKGDERIKEWESEKEKHEKKAEQLEGLLKKIDSSPSPEEAGNPKTLCLKALRDQKQEAEKDLSEIAGTLKLRKQIDILKGILEQAQQDARSQLKGDILEECRTKLSEILSFSPVEISEISGSLRLKGQDGASVGQTLAVAYTFLTTLLGEGQHQFPLIVDSPANPIDKTVRREIAGVIPKLTDQFVAFTISTERPGFTDHLHRAADADVRYLTLFRKNANTRPLVSELPGDGVQQTSDGILVEGRSYFEQFDDKKIEVE